MRVLFAGLKVALGLALGLALAEGLFWWRDDGAFPHVNFYEPDPALGARLEPNASMRLRVASGNPLTTAATNTLGFRAPEWPKTSAPGEVLVVGDSQVFGLGVEASETFSARLGDALKVPVLNAGTPTWGPKEYSATVERVLAERPGVRTVIYVLNLSNDLFEVERPNLERHRVWDGWAVRSETAPADEPLQFPFRQTLMSKSHLVFALRKWLHAGDASGAGFASEGSWRDIAKAGAQARPVVPEDEEARRLLKQRSALDRQLQDVSEQLAEHLEQKLREYKYVDDLKPFVGRAGNPRDILHDTSSEAARRIDETAHHLFLASIGAMRNDAALEALARKKKDARLEELLQRRRALRKDFDALRPEGELVEQGPLDVLLANTRRQVAARGAKLVVVALPLDVMVSAEEWKKYGVPPMDLSSTAVLRADLINRIERVGALPVDPFDALVAAEPGAFLQGDLHLTPKGHQAVADAIVKALQAPPTKKPHAFVLPEGRTWPPTEDEFRRADECVVKGSTAAGCETKLVGEWLRVACHERTESMSRFDPEEPVTIQLLSGGHGDALTWREQNEVGLITPVVEGDDQRVRVVWLGTEQELRLSWPRGGARQFAFGAPKKHDADAPEPMPEWKGQEEAELRGRAYALARQQHRSPEAVLDELMAAAREIKAPDCAPGQVNGGARLRCFAACDEAHPCAAGRCEPWPTGAYCAVP